MKKILTGMFLLLSVGLGFTACSDDDDDNNKIYDTPPEVVTAGTYTGTWTRETDGVEPATANGTLTFTALSGENAQTYVTNVKAECTELSLDKESVANITYAGTGFLFSNMAVANGFGTKFNGTISADGVATIAFTLTVKEGRKTYVYNYSFEGKKQ